MFTKLTLRMNEELIEKAKEEAKLRKVSLSRLVADYFKSLSRKETKQQKRSPVLRELSGILSSKDDKKLAGYYKKHIERKYL